MENLTSRHVRGHHQLNTKNHCQRCQSLSAKIKKNWVDATGELITAISPKSLQADCALCIQFRPVFESISGSPTDNDLSTPVHLYYLRDSLQWGQEKTIGLKFESFFTLRTVEIFPVQCVEFAYPQVIRQIVCPDKPDYQFIRGQLDKCNKTHGQECVRNTVDIHSLRVIDCKSRRLVTAKPGQPYACLSYVWGGSAAKETHSSGEKLPAEIPKTIEDAMAVAVALEIPFLWVDRYCIDQENLQEKHDTIQNMNRVYEGAEITIIAVCGDDPHHGLPGVRGTPRDSQLSFTLADTTFLAIEPLYKEINTTKWANRGWTYQEMLLSRRRLVFTKTQMYFQCGTNHCMESLHTRFTDSDFALRPQFCIFPTGGVGHNPQDLRDRLIQYYSRNLSFESDAVNAFKGIINAFDQSEKFPFRLTHFYGVLVIYKYFDEHLAQKSFIANLCWSLVKSTNQDGLSDSYQEGRSSSFPSWSWASTKTKWTQDNHLQPLQEFCMTGLSRCERIQVCFTHKTDGDMDPCKFSKHKDSCDMFLPLIKLTTWVVSCPLSRTPDSGKASMRRYGGYFELQPEASCRSVHVAYLGTQAFLNSQIVVLALMLEEVKPGIFRRIGLWSALVDLNVNDDWKSTCEILDLALQRRYCYLPSSNENRDGKGEEDMSLPQWKRRTVTII